VRVSLAFALLFLPFLLALENGHWGDLRSVPVHRECKLIESGSSPALLVRQSDAAHR